MLTFLCSAAIQIVAKAYLSGFVASTAAHVASKLFDEEAEIEPIPVKIVGYDTGDE